mgnify:CR=1 FL=1
MEQEVYNRHIKNQNSHWWFSARREIIFHLLDSLKLKRSKILDFGSGSGTNVNMLAKFGNVDIFETNLKAKRYLKKTFHNKKNIQVVQKIQKKKYDFILAADVIEHIKDDKKILKQFYEYLKKDGHILITVPAYQFLFSSKDKALKHYRRYTKSNLVKLLKNLFCVKKLSYFNFFLFVPISLSILILRFRKKAFIKYAETTPNIIVNKFLRYILSTCPIIESINFRLIKLPSDIKS